MRDLLNFSFSSCLMRLSIPLSSFCFFHFQQTKTPRIRLKFPILEKPNYIVVIRQSGIKLSKFNLAVRICLLYPPKTIEMNLGGHRNLNKKTAFCEAGSYQARGYFTLSYASWLNNLKTYVSTSIHESKNLSNPCLCSLGKGCE